MVLYIHLLSYSLIMPLYARTLARARTAARIDDLPVISFMCFAAWFYLLLPSFAQRARFHALHAPRRARAAATACALRAARALCRALRAHARTRAHFAPACCARAPLTHARRTPRARAAHFLYARTHRARCCLCLPPLSPACSLPRAATAPAARTPSCTFTCLLPFCARTHTCARRCHAPDGLMSLACKWKNGKTCMVSLLLYASYIYHLSFLRIPHILIYLRWPSLLVPCLPVVLSPFSLPFAHCLFLSCLPSAWGLDCTCLGAPSSVILCLGSG